MVRVFPLREKIYPQFEEYLQTLSKDPEEGGEVQPAVKCIDVSLPELSI